MEPSGQNSPRDGKNTQAQASSDEPHENDDHPAPEETPENNTSNEATEVTKNKVTPEDESLSSSETIKEQSITNSEAVSQEAPEASSKAITSAPKRLPVVLTYASRNRPRQPFYSAGAGAGAGAGPGPGPGADPNATSTSGGRGIPPPPSYYPNRRRQPQVVQEQPSKEGQRPQHQLNIPQQLNPMTNPFVNPFTNIVIWAPYPPKIDPNVPTYLAHLVDAEVLFVVQHLEAFEFFGNIDLPNIYLVQNKNGETIYYVYESTLCIPCMCKNSRSLQLHVMDMYQNEVIFMNKSCGCGLYFCCFPLIEVYSPPSVPIGAVIKKCNPCKEQFNIVDADENLMFRIYGDCSCLYCSRCMQYDFTIHALDTNQTEVGFIRRDFPGFYQYLIGSEYYGVSFPANMDVRIKAVFLGALFLIDFLYFE